MLLRGIRKEDLKELWEIHRKFYEFPFPDLSSPLYAIQNVVVNDAGKIVMAGICRLTSEGIFITNKDLPAAQRIAAISIMNDEMDKTLHAIGLEECHVFAENDANFLLFLKKLGFVNCTGIPLVSQGRYNVEKSAEKHV